jgi:ABC-2 type transport system permease protein
MRLTSKPKPLRSQVVEIWRYRELFAGLVRKELKVKYKNSILGFLWSMLNPALYLVVFYVVFQLVLKNNIPTFALFLLSGLVVWNLFSTSLPAATGSILTNASIVTKVAFPREVLPLATVGAALIHFGLQSVVLLGALAFFRKAPSPEFLPLVLPALLVLLIFASALGVLLAAVNVYLRDTQHLLELVLLAWFWMTPIVYPYRLVGDRLGEKSWLFRLNPITPIVLTFQRALYNRTEPLGFDGRPVPVLPSGPGPGWYLGQLVAVGAVSVVLMIIALRVFGRLEGNFAEEL